MVQIRRTLITLGSLALIAGLTAFASRDALWLDEVAKVQARIDNGSAQSASEWPQEVFAAALQAAAEQRGNDALTLYNRVEFDDAAPTVLRLAARYNSANLYLRQAIDASDSGDALAAIPNFELAKTGYRAILEQQPDHMAARYNLERALRRAPEAEVDNDEIPPPPPPAEQAITTMQIQALGLP